MKVILGRPIALRFGGSGPNIAAGAEKIAPAPAGVAEHIGRSIPAVQRAECEGFAPAKDGIRGAHGGPSQPEEHPEVADGGSSLALSAVHRAKDVAELELAAAAWLAYVTQTVSKVRSRG